MGKARPVIYKNNNDKIYRSIVASMDFTTWIKLHRGKNITAEVIDGFVFLHCQNEVYLFSEDVNDPTKN